MRGGSKEVNKLSFQFSHWHHNNYLSSVSITLFTCWCYFERNKMACAYSSSFEDHGSLPEGSVKILLLGDSQTGKTCLIRAFYGEYKTRSPFSHYSALVHPCHIGINDKNIEIGLYDVPGAEDYSLIQQRCLNKIDVFVFCYAINNYDSLFSLKYNWVPKFMSYLTNAKTVLVGTKADIRNVEPRGYPFMDYYVSFDLGSSLKEHHRLDSFLECSATLNEGVLDVFTNAVNLTL